jgi:hydrogenase nickel incorporation protein HypA/HybF
MHEMGIANSVLEAVATEMRRHPGKYPCKVGLRIGEMTAIDQDSLRFCFEALAKGTDMETISLEIEFFPRRHRCRQCLHEFAVQGYECRCPQCGSSETSFVSGDELELAYLEVEEYGKSTVGAESS